MKAPETVGGCCAAEERTEFLLEAAPPLRRLETGNAAVLVYPDEESMGLASALRLAAEQTRLAEANGKASMILMAAPSAYSFYDAYVRLAQSSKRLQEAIRKTHFFQFDDYRLPLHHPASFQYLLFTALFQRLAAYYDPEKVHFFDGAAQDIDAECKRYGDLILGHGPDLQLKGTGENGHWGFHEPGIPIDGEPRFMRVALTEENVAQQMRDHPHLFPSPAAAPREAYTANVPLFMRTRVLIEDNIPQPSKAFALLACYGSEKTDAITPSSMLKTHARAVIRTTEAAAWALMEYRERGRATADLLQRLADSLAGGGEKGGEAIRSKIRGTLQRMDIRCE